VAWKVLMGRERPGDLYTYRRILLKLILEKHAVKV
jgi:hypothetical protein